MWQNIHTYYETDKQIADTIARMAASPAPRGRRTQQERTAESTQRLLTAAIELIAEKGFARTSAAEISARAGYSRSMVQFRWGTKEALLESLLREEYETRLLPPAEDETAEETTGLEALVRQIDHLDTETAANPELMRGFFALCFEAIGPVPSLTAWIDDWLRRYSAATAEAIRRGQSDGSIRADLAPADEAEAFVAAGLGYSFRWMVAPDRTPYAVHMARWREQIRTRLTQ
jgi:AcrR family transcriptional regulator